MRLKKTTNPKFTSYIMTRVIVVALFITLISLFLIYLFIAKTDRLSAISIFSLTFFIFVYFLYKISKHIEKELNIINHYLSNLNNIDKIKNNRHLLTKEFEDINSSIIKLLKSSKKREDIKQRYNTKLKVKNRQRADMISALAHEFRNPIASIMGYSQTLEDDKNIPPQLQEKFLNKIYKNGIKIEELLKRLVLWNKFESGNASLKLGEFDILSLAKEVKSSLDDRYQNREIIIKGEPYIITADDTLIEIVLKNLIENAIKYSDDEILVNIDKNKISVSDKGVGISSDEIDKITKKFYRSSKHSWDNSMGLGLSIVTSILTLHKSKLEIESVEGEGSVFWFRVN